MKTDYRGTGFVRLCFQRCLVLMGLNLLFLVCCLPVLTVPAAMTALASACQGVLLDEMGIFRRFFRSFARNFLRASLLGLFFGAGIGAVLFCAYFYMALWGGEGASIILPVFCVLCAVLLLYIGTYAVHMLARVELGTWAILRNSFAMIFLQFRPLGWIVISAVMTALTLGSLPWSVPWTLLLGLSLPCFTAARGILPVLDDVIIKEQ